MECDSPMSMWHWSTFALWLCVYNYGGWHVLQIKCLYTGGGYVIKTDTFTAIASIVYLDTCF